MFEFLQGIEDLILLIFANFFESLLILLIGVGIWLNFFYGLDKSEKDINYWLLAFIVVLSIGIYFDASP